MSGAAETAAWDRNARGYGSQERWERRAVSVALRLAAAGPNDTVIDLATGTGAILRALARNDPRPAVAVGVDSSAGMLARVGVLPAGWSAMLADARHVPLEDGTADLVICSYLLQLLAPQTRGAVLAEARRLLRPEPAARIVVVTVWADRRRPGGRAVHRGLDALAHLRPAAWGGLAPLDPSEDLRAAGFRADRRVVLARGGYPSLVVRARPTAAEGQTTASSARRPGGAHHAGTSGGRPGGDPGAGTVRPPRV